MSEMPWVKLYTEFIDDPKFAGASDSVKLRFVQLVLLAGECDKDGALTTGDRWMTVEQIAWRLRVDAKQLAVEFTQLEGIGVLAHDDDGFTVCKFGARQGRSQEEKRAQWRERKQRQKERDSSEESESDAVELTQDSRVNDTGITLPEQSRADSAAAAEIKYEDKREKLRILGVEPPTLDKLAQQMLAISDADFLACFDRLREERLAASNGARDAPKIDNWGGYAVKNFRQLLRAKP